MSELILSPQAEAFKGLLVRGREFAEMIQAAREADDSVAETLAFAMGMKTLQDAVNASAETKAMIEAHKGQPWGFKVDQDYTVGAVVPIFCQALLNGVRAVGNEFNVIEASLYITKDGWRNLLERMPGVTELDCSVGVVSDSTAREFQTKKGYPAFKLTALIPATASCRVYGELCEVRAWQTDHGDERVQVTAIAEHEDLVIDQIKGKVEARMWERLYRKAKGISKCGASPISKQMRISTVAPVTRQSETESTTTVDDTPLGRVKSRLAKHPEKLAVIVEAWDAVSAAGSRDELEMLRNEIKVRSEAAKLTDGDKKELLALFAEKKKALQ